MVVQRAVGGDEFGLPGGDDGQHAVLDDRVRLAPVLGFPEGVFLGAEDVFRLGEGRHPAAILQPGVPPDMIDMQMRAHHVVDLFHRNAGGGEVLLPDIGGFLVPEGPRRAVLVVADAGIDQDVMVRRLDQIALDAEPQLAAGRIQRPQLFQPGPVFGQGFLGQPGEEFQRVEQRLFYFDDPMDFKIAEREAGFHLCPSLTLGGEGAANRVAAPPVRYFSGKPSPRRCSASLSRPRSAGTVPLRSITRSDQVAAAISCRAEKSDISAS